MQRKTFKTSLAALGLLAGSAYAQAPASTPVNGTVAAKSSYQAAPDATVHLAAPKEKCGIFENCANTKIGLGKGDFLIRLSALGVITNNTSSSVNIIHGGPGLAGAKGHITATNQVMPEFTFEYFFTDHISLDLIAASTRHEAKAHGTQAGDLDVGSFWVLPPTLTVAWHFRPHKRFNPYVGVGLTLAFFHNANPAHNGSPKLFDHLKPQTTVGPSFNIGFDYQLVGNWFLNVDAKEILLRTPIYLNHRDNDTTHGRIHARDSINPTTVAAGIEYRF